MQMQGNTILVAGAARGLGRGLAELLHRLGNEVLVFDDRPGDGPVSTAPGLRVVDLDLADPWSVAAFSEQVAALCPALNMLVDVQIAFPVKYLPGLDTLLQDDQAHEQRLEARRHGIQHLTGTLVPHFRKRTHSSVMSVSVGPVFAAPTVGGRAARPGMEGGLPACALSVRKRWTRACIEVTDFAQPSRAERVNAAHAPRPAGVSRIEFISGVAHLLAEGLHEMTALARLQQLWPAPQTRNTRDTRDDDAVSEAW